MAVITGQKHWSRATVREESTPQRRVLEQIAGHSAEEGQVEDAHPNRGVAAPR